MIVRRREQPTSLHFLLYIFLYYVYYEARMEPTMNRDLNW